MKEIHKIIVPIDFLQHTDQLVQYAMYIAKKFDATLNFTHVVENPHLYGDYDFDPAGAGGVSQRGVVTGFR